MLVDRAPYFYAKDLWKFVSGTRTTEYVDDTSVERVVGDSIQNWYFPPHAPERIQSRDVGIHSNRGSTTASSEILTNYWINCGLLFLPSSRHCSD